MFQSWDRASATVEREICGSGATSAFLKATTEPELDCYMISCSFFLSFSSYELIIVSSPLRHSGMNTACTLKNKANHNEAMMVDQLIFRRQT